jgi:hypothetical protein
VKQYLYTFVKQNISITLMKNTLSWSVGASTKIVYFVHFFPKVSVFISSECLDMRAKRRSHLAWSRLPEEDANKNKQNLQEYRETTRSIRQQLHANTHSSYATAGE